MDKQKTIVLFRKYPDGEILALFPGEKHSPDLVQSYMHVGQHSSANLVHCIQDTKPATPEEYEDLRKELETIGYNLDITTIELPF